MHRMRSMHCSALATALLAALALLQASWAAKLPRDFKRCNVTDVANLPKCLAPAVQDATRKMRNGIKSIGVPTLNPLLVDEMSLDLGSGPITLDIKGTNILLSGIPDSNVISANADLAQRMVTAKLHTPVIRMDFKYKANGKILLIAVNGEGPAFMELRDADSTHTIFGHPYERNGKQYWNITEYTVDIEPKRVVSRFDGLFKGDPRVSDQINKFLNDEWKVFFQQIKKPAESAFGSIFQLIANQVFNRVPIDEIFIF